MGRDWSSKLTFSEVKDMSNKLKKAIKNLFRPYCPRCEVGRMNFESFDPVDGKKIYKCERCNTRAK